MGLPRSLIISFNPLEGGAVAAGRYSSHCIRVWIHLSIPLKAGRFAAGQDRGSCHISHGNIRLSIPLKAGRLLRGSRRRVPATAIAIFQSP